jgi:uncharacterized protein YgbK (DUF1537 family)
MGLPQNFRRARLLEARAAAADFDPPAGATVMLAGSCSAATRGQVEAARAALPSLLLDADALADDGGIVDEAIAWARERLAKGPALIYSSADPAVVARIQERHGREHAGAMIEGAFARIAAALREAGVTRYIVAGGETSGAVVEALGVNALRIGPEIDPGVPWTTSIGGAPLALALKSGNFGAPDFFAKAHGMLP